MKNEKTVVDIDYAEAIVPKSARRGIVTMFMIMLGFTFFSASMWVGQQLADGLDFQGFVVSMIVGGVILSLYTGLLGYVGAETGMSLDLLARKAFGVKGSYLPSAMISFTQIGWFGVGIALRAGQNTQERLFRCTADAPCAEAVSLATGAWEQTFTGLAQDSCAAVCPVESKVYFGAAGADSLLAANR